VYLLHACMRWLMQSFLPVAVSLVAAGWHDVCNALQGSEAIGWHLPRHTALAGRTPAGQPGAVQ
jgi:hypothetical protein